MGESALKTEGTKYCGHCKEQRHVTEFVLDFTRSDRRRLYCRDCEVSISYKSMKTKWIALSLEDYRLLWRMQEGRCFFCGETEANVRGPESRFCGRQPSGLYGYVITHRCCDSTKECRGCGEKLERSYFGYDERARDRLRPKCFGCYREEQAARRAKNKGKSSADPESSALLQSIWDADDGDPNELSPLARELLSDENDGPDPEIRRIAARMSRYPAAEKKAGSDD